jgi:16S rRNA G966 N2-methylase RsmD
VNCGFEEKAAVFLKEAVKYVKKCEQKYNLIFMDPFYNDLSQKHLFNNLDNILEEGAFIVLLIKSGITYPALDNLEEYDSMADRTFGGSRVIVKSKAR